VRITIQGRRLPVTDAIKQYVEEKITKAVHNYTHNIKKVDVTISARGGDTGTHGAKQQKVDVTITTLRSGVVRVEDAEESLYASIDLVCDKVSRKLRKLKERMIDQGSWPGRAGPRVNTEEEEFKEYMDNLLVETMTKSYSEEEMRALELSAPVSGAPLPDTVVRSKVVNCDPMTTGEAIEAMEAVGHDFYMFRDTQSKGIQVVYKRQNGGYGVLVPQ
jgi:ribosomal subunit interface protein